MDTNFRTCMKPLLKHEGGFSDNKNDPGGATYKGVTQKTYDAYRDKKGLQRRSVRYMSDDEMSEIYYNFYWIPCGGKWLPSGVDYVVFDGAVNSGVRQSVKWLQRALRGQQLYEGGIDGQAGIQTQDAVNNAELGQLIEDICNQRLWFLQKLDTWQYFGKGWSKRVADVKRIGKSMLERVVQKASGEIEEDLPEAEVIDANEIAKAPPSSTKVTETPVGKVAQRTGGLAVGTLLLSMLDKASDYISLFTGLPSWLISYILVALTICAVVGIIAYAAIAIFQVIERKRQGEDLEAE